MRWENCNLYKILLLSLSQFASFHFALFSNTAIEPILNTQVLNTPLPIFHIILCNTICVCIAVDNIKYTYLIGI